MARPQGGSRHNPVQPPEHIVLSGRQVSYRSASPRCSPLNDTFSGQHSGWHTNSFDPWRLCSRFRQNCREARQLALIERHPGEARRCQGAVADRADTGATLHLLQSLRASSASGRFIGLQGNFAARATPTSSLSPVDAHGAPDQFRRDRTYPVDGYPSERSDRRGPADQLCDCALSQFAPHVLAAWGGDQSPCL